MMASALSCETVKGGHDMLLLSFVVVVVVVVVGVDKREGSTTTHTQL
jgi:hypothetical protein